MSTYWELIDSAAAEHPSATVAEDERGRSITARDLREAALAFAGAMYGDGMRPGDVVAWQLPTTIEAIVTMAGLSRLGAVQAPLVPIYRFREVAFAMSQTRATRLIVPTEFRGFNYAALAREVQGTVPGLEVLIIDEGSLPTAGAVEIDRLPNPPTSPNDPRWIFYTSGTTADPKGARHSDATILAAAAGYVHRVGFTELDRAGVTFPLSHIGGPTSIAASLMGSFPMILSSTFDPVATPRYFRERGVTTVSGPPIVHQAFVDAQRAHAGGRAFPTIRAFLGGGTPKPAGLSSALRDEVGAPLLSGYGATESPLATFCSPQDSPVTLDDTEGRPIAGVRLEVVNRDGHAAAVGEEGELRLSGAQQFLGYVDEMLDIEAFDDLGRFKTGDLGFLDTSQNVTISGRIKETIIRKGETLSAREIQEVLLQHPDIQDIAVIGLPDVNTGERACAVVVPRGDTVVTLEELIEFCHGLGMMAQKIPEQLELIDELPRNAMGKVMVAALRDRFKAMPS